ncbi:MAG: pyrroline-5-carboxylate reductase [Candidatus Gracilibacteria bacterium]|jgi:pyrroline-5-carboxylate reductase
MKNIAIIGLGNMGKSIYERLCVYSEFKVVGCEKGDDINNLIEKCDIFVIAIKPQDFAEMAKEIKTDLKNKIVISIMAGVSIKKIKDTLKIKKIVRVMPNLPLKAGMALSGWIASKDVSFTEKNIIREILKSFGKEIEVSNEEKINAITAISGSGPAYFYYLVEVLQSVAKKYGFNEKEAQKLAEVCFIGSSNLLMQENISAKELRQKVTSKGGTTEAAITSMSKNKFEKIILDAVDCAVSRAKELNN